MSEKKLYQNFKKHWKYYIERIESKNESGIPDLLLVDNNSQIMFVELKYIVKKFSKTVLPIKKTQFIWHRNITATMSYMLFQIENKYYIFFSCDVFNLRGSISWKKFQETSYFQSDEIEDIVNWLN